MSTRRKSLKNLWFLLVIGWSVLRIVFADVYFLNYGINIWIFAAVEAITSPILAYCSAHLVISLSEHRVHHSVGWAAASLTSFAAPDMYLLTAGKNLPWVAYGMVVGLFVVSGVVSLVMLRLKLRHSHEVA